MLYFRARQRGLSLPPWSAISDILQRRPHRQNETRKKLEEQERDGMERRGMEKGRLSARQRREDVRRHGSLLNLALVRIAGCRSFGGESSFWRRAVRFEVCKFKGVANPIRSVVR